jgi:hypothetical protein
VFETMRQLHPRGTANRGVCVDADGAVVGPDCVLIRRTPIGYRCVTRTAADDIQRVLLASEDNPDWLYEQGQRIAAALDRGEIALAQIYGLRIPISELDDRQLKRLAAITAFHKIGFDPDEPRIPAGQPGGGEWTTGGDAGVDAAALDTSDHGTLSVAADAHIAPVEDVTMPSQGSSDPGGDGPTVAERDLETKLIEAGYRLPLWAWAVVRALYRLFMAYGGDISVLLTYLEDRGLRLDELPAVIKSLFDPPRPLIELQTDKPPRGFDTANQLRAYLGDPPPGYEWHHIIEQNGQTREDLNTPEGIRTWIQNTENMVMIPVIKHYCINGFMSQTAPPKSGIVLRNTVRSMEPKDQRQMGIILLMLCRVIK